MQVAQWDFHFHLPGAMSNVFECAFRFGLQKQNEVGPLQIFKDVFSKLLKGTNRSLLKSNGGKNKTFSK